MDTVKSGDEEWRVEKIDSATAIPEFSVPITILMCGLLTLTAIGLKKRQLIP